MFCVLVVCVLLEYLQLCVLMQCGYPKVLNVVMDLSQILYESLCRSPLHFTALSGSVITENVLS